MGKGENIYRTSVVRYTKDKTYTGRAILLSVGVGALEKSKGMTANLPLF